METKTPSLSDIYNKALNLLSRREHSSLELYNKLLQRKFPSKLIEETLVWLKERDLQSNERFAGSFVRVRQGQGCGPLRIKRELKEKGVDAELFSSLVDPDDFCWFESANKVREKKFGDCEILDIKQRAKQMKFLQYRGFTAAQIRHAMRDVSG